MNKRELLDLKFKVYNAIKMNSFIMEIEGYSDEKTINYLEACLRYWLLRKEGYDI